MCSWTTVYWTLDTATKAHPKMSRNDGLGKMESEYRNKVFHINRTKEVQEVEDKIGCSQKESPSLDIFPMGQF